MSITRYIKPGSWRMCPYRSIVLGGVASMLTIGACGSLHAQETESPSVAPAASPTVELESRLKNLMNATERLRRMRELEASEQAAGTTNPSSGLKPINGSTAPTLAPANEILDAFQSQQPDPSTEMKEIRERIRVLQKLRRDSKLDSRNGSPLDPQILPMPSSESVATPPAVHPVVADALSAAAEASENADESSAAPDANAPNLSGQQVVPTPINSLALGESLYRLGNYPSALKALKEVDTEGLPQSDRMWLELMIAMCQRKSEKFESSIGTLRDLANDKSPDYPVQAAKWYLKYAESEQKRTEALNQLTDEIELIVKRVEDYDGNE
ncbi:hypothetical protein LOC67_15900 [Stieleria sp. JC731]|uniref:tetratricopeptide repeat protein n=1 Tax=Pirellulaceae TaxID=2691357 RepID=UPI001E4EFA9F|nr:hypothetical protein [Stieleria sp. JC731]MCC9602046.1 hypothetical protein [Stieleria sp. JC731]